MQKLCKNFHLWNNNRVKAFTATPSIACGTRARGLMLMLLLIAGGHLYAQDQSSEEILTEGKRLYRAELTSWNAMEYFSENYAEKSDEIGGSFSYQDSSGMKCVFFTRANSPTVLATITLDTTMDKANAHIDKRERGFTKFETELYYLQVSARQAMKTDDVFFKIYSHTTQDVIPIIDSFSRRVYIMTGVRQSCLVIFGNDYLIAFDDNYKISYKKSLHKNIIPVECAHDVQTTNNIPGTMHIHNMETGNLPTATDICSLLLYAKQAMWKQHTIVGPEMISVWNCDREELTVMTKDEYRAAHASTH